MTEQHVHLMFGMSEQGVMKAALHKAEIRHSHKVLSFNDWFAYGPLSGIDLKDGESNRIFWMSQRLSNFDKVYMYNPDHQIGTVIKAIKAIPEGSRITIWHGDHAHDQIGLRFAVYLLQDQDVQIVLNNAAAEYQALFLRDVIEKESGNSAPVMLPVNLAQLKKEHFIPMLNRLEQKASLSGEQRVQLTKDWHNLSLENLPLRLWENNQFKCSDENALDDIIDEVVSEMGLQFEDHYVPASKVVAEVLLKLHRYYLRKDFLEFRLRSLIETKKLQFKGAPGQLHRYSVKIG
ncbi:DUF1835 domain-containing protein [Paenibacillus provencensis]|uniref:DUF1835 domain-containing protein n=1 Tax=Paenibacillus provencensis TaxID=441151 RepID=A0ABW3PIQ9_9BACL|nr:DUF1835 domain-containing protein [Paenibacillus sp. MER 78]MCM3126878.1 DUF1835 domain-containing protein [Paenibacillus sp. MER 78]